jgi:hypothetical protein
VLCCVVLLLLLLVLCLLCAVWHGAVAFAFACALCLQYLRRVDVGSCCNFRPSRGASRSSSQLLERAQSALTYFTTAIAHLTVITKTRMSVHALCDLAQALFIAGDAAAAQHALNDALQFRGEQDDSRQEELRAHGSEPVGMVGAC